MIIGFESIKSRLLEDYQNQKLHHAILFYGKNGIGKASFAKSFALEIIAQIANNHPDLFLIEKEENKRDISVDKIRKIADFFNQTSAISKNKFVIIDGANNLNRSSSNALLKILEEPHQNNFLILTTNSLGKILPTIKSRCHLVKVDDLNFEQFSKILHNNHPKMLPKISDDEMKILSEISDNSPSKAIRLGEDMIESYKDFLSSIKSKKIDEKIYKKIADKNFDFEIFLEIIFFFLRRLNEYKFAQIKYFIFDEKEIFLQLGEKISFELSEEIVRNLSKVISLNLDKKLALINVFNRICF